MTQDINNPDGQAPLPFAVAEDYAHTVMQWSREALPPVVLATYDQSYGPHPLQRYDVFAPSRAQNAPVLVFWHGGGWTNGYRDWVRFMAPHVTRLGLVLVAPSYRLAPEHPLPCALDDALQLLLKLKQTNGMLGWENTQFYLSGHSAGGHIAALTTLRIAARTQAGLPPDCLRGCLPISGIMDLHEPNPAPGSLEERVYTTVLKGQPRAMDTVLSPLFWTAGNCVPFALTYGEKDSPRVIKSNQRLLAMLQAQGSPVDCVMEAGRDHFQTHTGLKDPADGWYGRLAAMVAKR